LVKPQTNTDDDVPSHRLSPIRTGPSFRRLYNRFGPTTPGEYIPPRDDEKKEGTYVLSYPGIAFSFPLQNGTWNSSTTWASTVSLLSSNATGAASSVCLYSGTSWQNIRNSLFSTDMTGFLRSPVPQGLKKEHVVKEIETAKVYDRGRIEFVRKDAPNFWLILSETTPQDLVTELGPPDSIYRKNDRRLSIHRARKNSSAVHSRRGSSNSDTQRSPAILGRQQRTDSDRSSTGYSSESDDESDEVIDDRSNSDSDQVFYNYYSHGFDILISNSTQPSSASPLLGRGETVIDEENDQPETGPTSVPPDVSDNSAIPRSHLTATKIIFHGNVPGSWSFNRHRRLRWTLESVSPGELLLNSEMHWKDLQLRLQNVFHKHYETEEAERAAALPMVVNRGWAREEFGMETEWGVVGGWEDGSMLRKKSEGRSGDTESERMGAAEVYGFPGLVFEVLKNGAVSCLMVY